MVTGNSKILTTQILVSNLALYLPSVCELDLSNMFKSLPILPPHLLQCDPALLPEHNHVMLNHLYSLSIKFLSPLRMVRSATHRYKKKYVTTLMYKPIWPEACGCMSLSGQRPVAV
uniref:Association with the SNF1 complex (ASC) domain-containing protein n=1 Tax=Salmo trutta TaxID=8032 RepID=A0A674BBR3_SALTR